MAAVIDPAWSCRDYSCRFCSQIVLEAAFQLVLQFFFGLLQSLPAVSFLFSSCRLAMGALRTREFQLRRPPGFFQAHWSFFAG